MPQEGELLIACRLEELLTWARLGFYRFPASLVFRADALKLADDDYRAALFHRIAEVLPGYEDEYEILICRSAATAMLADRGISRHTQKLSLQTMLLRFRDVRGVIPMTARAREVLVQRLEGLVPLEAPLWEDLFQDYDRREESIKRGLAGAALCEMFGYSDADLPGGLTVDKLADAFVTGKEQLGGLLTELKSYHRPVAGKKFPTGDLGYFYDLGRVLKLSLPRRKDGADSEATSLLTTYSNALAKLSKRDRNRPLGELATKLSPALGRLEELSGGVPPASLAVFFRLQHDVRESESHTGALLNGVRPILGVAKEDDPILAVALALLGMHLGFTYFYQEYYSAQQPSAVSATVETGSVGSTSIAACDAESLGHLKVPPPNRKSDGDTGQPVESGEVDDTDVAPNGQQRLY